MQHKNIRQWKYNELGFGVVAILVLVLGIGLAGLIGWRVYEAAKPKPDNSVQTNTPGEQSTSQDEEDVNSEPKTIEIYENKTYGYSFEYPVTWKKATNELGQEGIVSPEFASTNEGIGYHLTSGANIYVVVGDTTATNPTQWMSERGGIPDRYAKDRTETMVDNTLALSYKLHYETSPILSTATIKNGRVFEITMQYADEAALGKYEAGYDAVIKSFEFLN